MDKIFSELHVVDYNNFIAFAQPKMKLTIQKIIFFLNYRKFLHFCKLINFVRF